ncbi:hypothetical protein Cni_G12485 [Canna indica]|uniref:Polyphenol oxidase C-terminal domain-containing protein n=1 Tax=Canna indica TaxID=4628 RepID=A0AAQ3QCT1_9LILI|nr:hypothetical protein Cni_G12485 [Canna indica]
MAIAAPGISSNTCIAARPLRRDLSRRRFPLPRVLCRRQISDADEHTDARLLHRRGVLIALGGLCSTAAGPMALAKLASTTGGIVRERYIDSNPLFVSTGGDATGEPATSSSSLVRVGEFGAQPRKLEAATPLRVLVARPKKDRTEAEKAEELEVLEISGIKVDADHPARFDVYIAAPRGSGGDLVGPELGEFAGTYSRAPSLSLRSSSGKASKKLGLNSVLKDIKAESAEKLVVSLVLLTGEVTVGGIAINLRKSG